MNQSQTISLPNACPSLLIPSRAELPAKQTTFKGFPSGDPAVGRAAMWAKRREWARLALNPETQLRQSFADEAFMRQHLSAAGIRVADSNEPATVSRLRSLLRKAGITGEHLTDSIGTDLAGFLRMNPKLPLWAAVALVLESTEWKSS